MTDTSPQQKTKSKRDRLYSSFLKSDRIYWLLLYGKKLQKIYSLKDIDKIHSCKIGFTNSGASS